MGIEGQFSTLKIVYFKTYEYYRSNMVVDKLFSVRENFEIEYQTNSQVIFIFRKYLLNLPEDSVLVNLNQSPQATISDTRSEHLTKGRGLSRL